MLDLACIIEPAWLTRVSRISQTGSFRRQAGGLLTMNVWSHRGEGSWRKKGLMGGKTAGSLAEMLLGTMATISGQVDCNLM